MTTETFSKLIPFAPGAVKADQRLVSGWISTTDVDMDGDVVLPSGMDDQTYFTGTKSVNLEHAPEKAVGTCRNLTARTKGVYATTYVGSHALGEDTMKMLEEGIIRGHSIEWDPRTLVSGPPTKEEAALYGPKCKNVFRKWTLTRYAFTARPCNPYCLVDGVKSMGYRAEMAWNWSKLDNMLCDGAIHRSSAEAVGYPADRKFYAVTEPPAVVKPRRVVIVGGVSYRKSQ